jgi:hypothetical protein
LPAWLRHAEKNHTQYYPQIVPTGQSNPMILLRNKKNMFPAVRNRINSSMHIRIYPQPSQGLAANVPARHLMGSKKLHEITCVP